MNFHNPPARKELIMNIPDSTIEETLRHAPRPAAPADLRDRLLAQISLPNPGCSAPQGHEPQTTWHPRHIRGGWWRRWWPALAPAAVSLACVVTVGVQQMEIEDLRRILAPLKAAQPAAQDPAVATVLPSTAEPGDGFDESDELARLRQLVNRLSLEIADLEKMRAENDRLRAALVSAQGSGLVLTPEETAALAAAREKAEMITCVNNLKQLGLAAHIWANDHDGLFPSGLAELSGLLQGNVTVCPRDAQAGTQRPYEYLRPAGEAGKEPNLVMFRCSVHGNICLADGSVQSEVATKRPYQLVDHDGVLYFDPNAPAPAEAQAK